MENFSKLRRNSTTTETNNIIDNTNEMKNFFHHENGRKLGLLIGTTISNIP